MNPADAPATITIRLRIDAVVPVGDPDPQLVEPGGVGVAERLVERRANGVGGDPGERGRRLADLQVQDPTAGGLEFARRPPHRHRVERRHRGGPECSVDHRAIVAPGRPIGRATPSQRAGFTCLTPVSQAFLTLHSPDARHGRR